MVNIRERYWKEQFDKSALMYEGDAAINLWHEHNLIVRKETFMRVFGKAVSCSKKILDVGCGSGIYSTLLANLGHDVTGVDYSEEMIKRAVEKSRGRVIRYEVANVYSLPFQDCSFDVVVSIGLFQHLTQAEKAITEITRVLKKDGVLLLMTLNALSIKHVLDTVILPRNYYLRTYHPYNIRSLLIKAGLNRTNIYGVFIFPKKLAFLETFFKWLEKITSLSLFFAHAFTIEAR